MKATFAIGKVESAKSDAIGLFAFENSKKLDGQGGELGAEAKKIIAAAMKRSEFGGKKDELLTVRDGKGALVLVAGLGKRKECCPDRVRRAAARIASAANGAKAKSLAFSVSDLCDKKCTPETLANAICEGAMLYFVAVEKLDISQRVTRCQETAVNASLPVVGIDLN